MIQTIKAILFDLDGTLVDAAPWHAEAFNLALRFAHVKPLSEEEHEKDFNGLSSKQKCAKLLEQGRIRELWIDPILTAKQQYTIEIIKERCRPLPNVIETVKFAKHSFQLGLVTNCSRTTTMLMLELSGLSPSLFNLILTNEDVKKNKPDPYPYLLAQEKLGMLSCECLIVEDSEKGLESAKASGSYIWKVKSPKDIQVPCLIARLLSCN